MVMPYSANEEAAWDEVAMLFDILPDYIPQRNDFGWAVSARDWRRARRLLEQMMTHVPMNLEAWRSQLRLTYQRIEQLLDTPGK